MVKNNKTKAKTATAKGGNASQSKSKAMQNPRVLPKGTASAVGALLGSMFGPAGTAMGGAAGGLLGKITGFGDYKVKYNTITDQGQSLTGEVPSFGASNNSVRIRHREFIGNIVVPNPAATFDSVSYVINPSNSTLFPWLSKIAENFQQYKLCGAVFVFKTTTSDYAANGALGKVALATNYNVLDSDYANMVEMENSEFAVSGKPSMSKIHPIECASNNGPPLVRWVRDAGYDAVGGDARLYDVGKFQIATEGLPGTPGQVIGGLWISYDIEFYKPIVGRDSGGGGTYRAVDLLVETAATGATWPTPDEYMVEQLSLAVSGQTTTNTRTAVNNPAYFIRDAFSAPVSYSPLRNSLAGTAQSDEFVSGSKPVADWPARWMYAGPNPVLRLQKNGFYYMVYRTRDVEGPARTDAFALQNEATANIYWEILKNGAATYSYGDVPESAMIISAGQQENGNSGAGGYRGGGRTVLSVAIWVKNADTSNDYVDLTFNWPTWLSNTALKTDTDANKVDAWCTLAYSNKSVKTYYEKLT